MRDAPGEGARGEQALRSQDAGEAEYDFGLLDRGNPRSLVNIVPDLVRQAMLAVPPKLFLEEEAALKRRVRPSPTLNYLRLNFWLEYNRAQEKRKDVRVTEICRGVCSKEYFYQVVLTSHDKIAWMMLPPADYSLVQADILYSGLEKLKKVLRLPLYDVKVTEKVGKDGKKVRTVTKKPNAGLIGEVRKITMYLSDRVQGSVIQKLAVKAQHSGQIGGGPVAPGQVFDTDALDGLTKQLTMIEKQMAAIGDGGIIEATIIEEIPAAAEPPDPETDFIEEMMKDD